MGGSNTPSLRAHGIEDDDENEVTYQFMSTISNQLTDRLKNEPKDGYFYVVHPLDDLPEEKVKSEHLPPLAKSWTVRWSLFTLRAYLIIMMLLIAYHVVELARQVWR